MDLNAEKLSKKHYTDGETFYNNETYYKNKYYNYQRPRNDLRSEYAFVKEN